MTSRPVEEFRSSTGSVMGQTDWLDVHFEAHRPEYEQAFTMAGFQPGWHVLDAGCGGGIFLPLLAAAVGPTGRISAVDLDPDNVEMATRRVDQSTLPCPVGVRVGDLRELPYPDNTFDAVWCANSLMYITDDDLSGVLAELKRVARPGGLVVSKETDGELYRFMPVPFEHRAPLYAANLSITGIYRTRQLVHWYRGAGLENVWAKSALVERWAPLDQINRQHIIGNLRLGLSNLKKLDPATISPETQAFWETQSDPDSPECIVNRPDFAFTVAHLVTVGTVPE